MLEVLPASQWKGLPLLLLREMSVESDGMRFGVLFLLIPALPETSLSTFVRRRSGGDPYIETEETEVTLLPRLVGVLFMTEFPLPSREFEEEIRLAGVVILVTLPGPSRELEEETRLRLTASAEQICGIDSLFSLIFSEPVLEDESPRQCCVRALSVLDRTIFARTEARDFSTRMLELGRGPEMRGFRHCRLATVLSSALSLFSISSSTVGE